jgi:hypothetical protein
MSQRILQWIALAAVLAGLLAFVSSAPAADLFGRIHFDDGIYFGSAKVLSEEGRYVVASMPGSPPQTKYPVLYPWMLSWVWSVHPDFPANVKTAAWLSGFFGCWFLVASFLCLSRQPGIGPWVALGCVALTSIRPNILDMSSSLMSDMPFMAFAVTTLLLAELGFDDKKPPGLVVLAGLFAGLMFLTRTSGVAFIAGVIVWALARKHYGRSALFAAGCAPFLIGHGLWVLMNSEVLALAGTASLGWRQVWTYQTNYAEFWKLSVPSWDVFLNMLSVNITSLLTVPASMALFPPAGGEGSMLAKLLAVALSFGIFSGLLRHLKSSGFAPVHVALLLSGIIGLLWNFPIMARLLAVFLPWFYLGVWVEGRYIGAATLAVVRSQKPKMEKAFALIFASGLLFVFLYAARSHFMARLRFGPTMQQLAEQFGEKEEAAQWLKSHAAGDDIFLAYSDSRLHLETGRRAVWPIVFTTDILFEGDESLERQFGHYMDVGSDVGARYWVASDDDLAVGTDIGKKCFADWEGRFPIVFRSSGGTVRIHDLSTLKSR